MNSGAVTTYYGVAYPHMRADLVWAEGVSASSASPSSSRDNRWSDPESVSVVKDPIALKYFRLRHDERFVLELLNGQRSANSIRDRYNAAFPPRRVTTAQIQQLILRFCREGLAVASSPDHYRTMVAKRQRLGMRQWQQWLTAWLFIRFPGFYANPIVGRIEQWMRPCLGMLGLNLACGAVVVSLLWLVTHAEQFWVDAGQLSRWASVHGVISLSIAIAIVKTLHELGHGVACRRFGGECHEIGMLLMCCIPCLYCDTSDAWLIRSRSQRQAVNLAGVFVELLVASAAVAIWASTYAGFLHWLSVDLILVCMLSSILINGNPLLRYDGYYVLADGLRVENLAIESRQRLDRFIRGLLWGEDRLVWPERSFAMQAILVIYAALSLAYRCAIMLGLAWMLILACRLVGYERLGWQLVGAGALTMAIVAWFQPAIETWRRHQINRWRRSSSLGKWLRPWIALSLMGGLLALIMFFPMSQSFIVNGHLHRSERVPVVATAAGILQNGREYGGMLADGDILVELQNSELELELMSAQQEMIAQRTLVETLERSVVNDPRLADQLPTARSLLESLVQQVDSAQRRVDRLVIRAPQAGEWVEPLRAVRRPVDQQVNGERLGGWSGLLLMPRQHHAFVEAGTVIGWICVGASFKADVLVDESNVQWLQVGQLATICLAAAPDQLFNAKVTTIALQPIDELTPRAATIPGVLGSASAPNASSQRSDRLASSTGSEGSGETSGLQTSQKSYWVTLELDSGSEQEVTEATHGFIRMDGLDVRANIEIGRQSMASHLWRWLSGQVRF
jgi:putative peptide zinc metalloprotease protein